MRPPNTLKNEFKYWEITKDLIDQCIDIMLNLRQDKRYRDLIIAPNQWNDTMVITNGALRLMNNWIVNPTVKKYSMSPDFDNRWRTGGSVDQIIEESQLDPESIYTGINKFAKERLSRLNNI